MDEKKESAGDAVPKLDEPEELASEHEAEPEAQPALPSQEGTPLAESPATPATTGEEPPTVEVSEEQLEQMQATSEEQGAPAGGGKPGAKKRLGAWFGRHTKKVVSQLYESRVDDIEHRARRAVSSAYEDQADDLEQRAVRAMRTALTEEADRIKEVIEHAVAVKKREVRLSLLVLVIASLLYLLLYWATR